MKTYGNGALQVVLKGVLQTARIKYYEFNIIN